MTKKDRRCYQILEVLIILVMMMSILINKDNIEDFVATSFFFGIIILLLMEYYYYFFRRNDFKVYVLIPKLFFVIQGGINIFYYYIFSNQISLSIALTLTSINIAFLMHVINTTILMNESIIIYKNYYMDIKEIKKIDIFDRGLIVAYKEKEVKIYTSKKNILRIQNDYKVLF